MTPEARTFWLCAIFAGTTLLAGFVFFAVLFVGLLVEVRAT